jgi:cyclophilin family peptidyl-prolyl cis-trans isomerase/protein-disulfide isomerase
MLLAACTSAPATPSATPTTQATSPATNPTGAVTPDGSSSTTKVTCQVVSLSPTQGPTEASMFPPISDSDWVLGDKASATLTIIEYSDFQCPYCAQLAPILEELQKNHPDDVRVAFRYFPLPSHPLSLKAAAAADAAGQQGKFWEMHNALFENQSAWSSMTEADFQSWVENEAQTLKLDKAKFVEAMNSKDVTDKVQTAQKHGQDIGIPGTPMVLINGQYYQGPRDLASFEAILKMFGLKDRQFNYCPPTQLDLNKQYTATIKTEKGDIVIQLYPDKAPMAVSSFVFLARQGWFNDITFHRVLQGFVAQTGDPSGTGFGGPGYSFGDEITDLKFDKEGVVAMANSGANTNGSQFFITLASASQLDGKYTIFGQVVQGMEVVKKLTPRDPSQSADLPAGDKIITVEIQEK